MERYVSSERNYQQVLITTLVVICEFLDEAEWSSFEEKESQFRAQIASRRLNNGDFICKGDISLWMQVHKILHGIFYKNQNFQFVQPNGRHWSV